MNDFIARLETEKLELEEKIDKLNKFLMLKEHDIEDVQRALLTIQVTAMNTYLHCLLERIKRIERLED